MSVTFDRGETESYYGRPILKEPVWKPEIPLYLFSGGLAGASSVLSMAARVAGNERLAKTSLYVGFAAEVACPALLISDLGRPERFLNMLRVFKVTSPMNVGSWILTSSGGATAAAAACEAIGVLPRVTLVAEGASALLGAPLATYTATLLSDTAIPVWHEARRELPFVFGASAAASAGAAATLLLPVAEAGPARRLAVGAAVAENAATAAMEARLGFVGEPYRKGAAGALSRASKIATLGGAWLLARSGRRSRRAAVAGSFLLLGGQLALRWSVFKAGFQSARDPRYTVRPQRERRDLTDSLAVRVHGDTAAAGPAA
jgi:formate-dependent nitrite reductase membrane component NrfD